MQITDESCQCDLKISCEIELYYSLTKPKKQSCASIAIILLTNSEQRRCFAAISLKYPHGPAFVIKTLKKNVTLDVFRNGVMSLLCFKE